MAEGRRTFWPTVLLGAAGAGLAAYAGHRHWVGLSHTDPFAAGQQAGLDSPATTALALVALAAWGVVLVTRRWVRRGVAVLAGAAAVAVLPTVVTTRHHLLTSNAGAHADAWPWVALVAALVSAAMAVVAVRMAPQWPEMGAKYDAPTGARSATATPAAERTPLEEQSSLDLWKSLDEGHDPTRDVDRRPD
ncbi:Trp biosynthesis-associated membrane protein [Nocardioides sp. BP30]|uniref:Trp biosynthesis-associated membrane protein n=1 Tax=Nocardioides sp. BP30 TaxID=3036374 RepID=UPI002469A18E|nr:Trp biosynthesis-associated membrane protein [Nocardioides sp. BP30]WGL53892.1 Trp biosynthesis-associated membrane protein [Nocardioides sp. BP30]